jgi:peptidyl-prolyl cis-trans isomerase SurA
MLRRAIYTAAILFFLILTTSPARARIVEQLIVVIDGEPYTLSNVGTYSKTKMSREFPSGDLKSINDNDREVLEQFITEKLLEAEIRESGIKVTDEDIDQYIGQIKTRNQLTEDDLKRVLSREGMTFAAYRLSVKSELERGEIINRQVRRRVNITNEDVERYYKLNAQKYRSEDRVRVRHILLPLPEDAPQEKVQEVMSKGQEVYNRASNGEDFAKLAQEVSEGAGRSEGGSIGWVKRGTLIKGIDDVAFETLSVGQVSQPFRTAMGVHLVQLEAREAGRPLPLASVAAKIKEELYGKAMEERFLKWLKTDLRKKHRVDVKIPGVVFRPDDSKDGTVDTLLASTSRRSRRQERSLLSYLNPFSYVLKETPLDDDDPKAPFSGKSLVSLFGIPLFVSDSADDVPDILATPPDKAAGSESSSQESRGFFSSVVDSLNPFKR